MSTFFGDNFNILLDISSKEDNYMVIAKTLIKMAVQTGQFKSNQDILDSIMETFGKKTGEDRFLIKSPGYLYCIYNKSLNNGKDKIYKLGRTKNLNSLKGRYTTSYPESIDLLLNSDLLSNDRIGESILFSILEDYRYSANREFFQCEFRKIEDAFDTINMFFKNRQYDKFNHIFDDYMQKYLAKIRALFKEILDSEEMKETLDDLDYVTLKKVDPYSSKNVRATNASIIKKVLDDSEDLDTVRLGRSINCLVLFDKNFKLKPGSGISLDNKRHRYLEYIEWIESKLNIERFKVNDIYMDNKQIEQFNEFLKEKEEYMDCMNISRSTGRLKKEFNGKLNNIVSLDRLRKYIAWCYNVYDKLIIYDQRRKSRKKIATYSNFRLNKQNFERHIQIIDNFVANPTGIRSKVNGYLG